MSLTFKWNSARTVVGKSWPKSWIIAIFFFSSSSSFFLSLFFSYVTLDSLWHGLKTQDANGSEDEEDENEVDTG